jgi:hypothetical protein
MPLDSTHQHRTTLFRSEEETIGYESLLAQVGQYTSQYVLDHSEFEDFFSKRMNDLVDQSGHPAHVTIPRTEAERWLRAFRVILEREVGANS